MGSFDVACSNDSLAVAGEGEGCFAAVVHFQHYTLEIQQNVDYVFTDSVQCRVFVEHAFDRYLGRGNAFHRGQQDATQGVAQRVAVAAFERLHYHTGMHRRKLLDIDTAGFQKCVHVHSFEWETPGVRWTPGAKLLVSANTVRRPDPH